MAKYDKEAVRTAAQSHWIQILSQVGSLRSDWLDGRAHPCPKCAGKDRFRLIDANAGAVLCNQCFREKNGDGFAALMWLTGLPFPDVLDRVASFCGIKPTVDPSSGLEFLPWNELLVGMWCLKKPPIQPFAIQAVGGRLARYRKRWTVIALPVCGKSLDHSKPVGWVLYNATGGMLPAWGKDKSVEYVKIKTMPGTESGLIGVFAPHTRIIKTEGPSDLLALISMGLTENEIACCNVHGCKENPAKTPWLSEFFSGHEVVVIHDADEEGLSGATIVGERIGWAPFAATTAASCKLAKLPFKVTPNHGKDLRDFFAEGATRADFDKLLDQAEPIADPGPVEPKPIEADDDPYRLYRVNMQRYRDEFGRDLKYWREAWYAWKHGRYVQITEEHIENRICQSIKCEFDRIWLNEFKKYEEWKSSPEYDEEKDKGPPKVRKINTNLIRNVVKITKSECSLGNSQKMHAWIKDGQEGWCVAVQNGILNLSKLLNSSSSQYSAADILMPHTANWFSTVALPYKFDPSADCQTWKKFLNDAFSHDLESIDALQKWFGYLLTPDKSLHKILFVIGRTRSGKGTIMRVLRAVFGEDNIATPTLTELSSQFGLESMIGKTCALITDARISMRADESTITERLLSISGNDPQNVQRKFISTLVGHDLNVRFTIFSNMLPRLSDTSSAFMSRGLFLFMPNTYEGREDRDLADKLLAELPGILNWAIVGRLALNETRRITQPESGRPLLKELRSILGPIQQFMDERCLVRVNEKCETKELFAVWYEWCQENDIANVGTIQSFSRKIKAVSPGIDTIQERDHNGRRRYFVGLSITEPVLSDEF